jgi:dTMP kinase
MKVARGRFIVLEGIDGSGTTTQAQLLSEYLDIAGATTSLTREPTDYVVGRLIREALSGKLVGRGSMGKITLSEAALCLLFAADRIEHSLEIEVLREGGTHVICDRFVLSSIAYQSLDANITAERVIDVNRGIAVPDVTFLLDVPVDECLKRLGGRTDAPTVYEKKEILEGISRNYEATRPIYEAHFGPVIRIDGTKAAEEVHSEIRGHLSTYISI